MQLVGKPKVLKYIELNPETRVELLISLQREKQALRLPGISGGGGASLTGKIDLQYVYNTSLGIRCITRVINEKEREDRLKISKASAIFGSRSIETKGNHTVIVDTYYVPEKELAPVEQARLETKQRQFFDKYRLRKRIKSEEEYLEIIDWITENLTITEDSHQFKFARKLTEALIEYEDANVQIPKLETWEAIKFEMEIRQMVPENFSRIVPDVDELKRFLEGKTSLAKVKINALCKRLKIDYLE